MDCVFAITTFNLRIQTFFFSLGSDRPLSQPEERPLSPQEKGIFFLTSEELALFLRDRRVSEGTIAKIQERQFDGREFMGLTEEVLKDEDIKGFDFAIITGIQQAKNDLPVEEEEEFYGVAIPQQRGHLELPPGMLQGWLTLIEVFGVSCLPLVALDCSEPVIPS